MSNQVTHVTQCHTCHYVLYVHHSVTQYQALFLHHVMYRPHTYIMTCIVTPHHTIHDNVTNTYFTSEHVTQCYFIQYRMYLVSLEHNVTSCHNTQCHNMWQYHKLSRHIITLRTSYYATGSHKALYTASLSVTQCHSVSFSVTQCHSYVRRHFPCRRSMSCHKIWYIHCHSTLCPSMWPSLSNFTAHHAHTLRIAHDTLDH